MIHTLFGHAEWFAELQAGKMPALPSWATGHRAYPARIMATLPMGAQRGARPSFPRGRKAGSEFRLQAVRAAETMGSKAWLLSMTLPAFQGLPGLPEGASIRHKLHSGQPDAGKKYPGGWAAPDSVARDIFEEPAGTRRFVTVLSRPRVVAEVLLNRTRTLHEVLDDPRSDSRFSHRHGFRACWKQSLAGRVMARVRRRPCRRGAGPVVESYLAEKPSRIPPGTPLRAPRAGA